MRFVKMQGAGNDYVYVDCFREDVPAPETLARAVSDRHFGIGSDGLILILPSERADVRMRMFNPDGSESEMCGNGIRCVAKYAVDSGLAAGPSLTVETGRGVLALDTFADHPGGAVGRVRVAMGAPLLDAAAIPFLPAPGAAPPFLEQQFMVAEVGREREIRGSVVSMGNPHLVVFVDDVESYPVGPVGALLECHPAFPRRTNVEFVTPLPGGGVRVRTWERGTGETLACGTGASAVAVVMRLLRGHTGPLEVFLSGGQLTLEWDGQGSVLMTGPAVEVFRGEYFPAASPRESLDLPGGGQ